MLCCVAATRRHIPDNVNHQRINLSDYFVNIIILIQLISGFRFINPTGQHEYRDRNGTNWLDSDDNNYVFFLHHDLCHIVLKLQTLALIQLRDHISVRMHGMVGVAKQSQVIILNQLFCNCGSVYICVNAALSLVKMTCVIIYIYIYRHYAYTKA